MRILLIAVMVTAIGTAVMWAAVYNVPNLGAVPLSGLSKDNAGNPVSGVLEKDTALPINVGASASGLNYKSVVFKKGTTITFSYQGLMKGRDIVTYGFVKSGTLASDTAFTVAGQGQPLLLKGGTAVTFSSYVAVVGGSSYPISYPSSLTLAKDQTLLSSVGPDKSVLFKAGAGVTLKYTVWGNKIILLAK